MTQNDAQVAGPMGRVLLLTPTRAELTPIAKGLGLRRRPLDASRRGRVHGVEVVAVATGMGPDAFRENASRWCERVAPTRLMLAGLAGALSPELRVGEVLAPQQVLTEAKVVWDLCRGLEPPQPRHRSQRRRGQHGVLLGSDELLETPEAKRDAWTNHDAEAVDMESHVAAELAAARALPLTIRRAVSDRADEQLPGWTRKLVRRDGGAAVARATAMAVMHPSRIGVMLDLARRTNNAGLVLAMAIDAAIQETVG